MKVSQTTRTAGARLSVDEVLCVEELFNRTVMLGSGVSEKFSLETKS